VEGSNMLIMSARLKSVGCIIGFSLYGGSISQVANSPELSNIDEEGMLWQTPLLDSPKSIALSHDKRSFVVVYEEKGVELWSSIDARDGYHYEAELISPDEKKIIKYRWSNPYFLGSTQELIVCANQGLLHFWRRKTRKYVCEIADILNSFTFYTPVLVWGTKSNAQMLVSAPWYDDVEIWGPPLPVVAETQTAPAEGDVFSDSKEASDDGSVKN